MGQISIQDLPPEILATILIRLHPRELVSCHLVSRFWNDLIRSSPDIQYSIELWRDGLLCGDPGTLTPAECLTRLHARRNAWRGLKWSSKSVVGTLSLEDCRAYELGGGVFALQENSVTFDMLPLARLTEVDDPNEAIVTGSLHVPMTAFEDFAIDPGQDLLAVLYIASENEGILALRRLSEPETAHPSAPVQEISFSCSLADTTVLAMQILDGIVTVHLHSASRLMVFDWRKGVPLLMLEFKHYDEYYKLDVVDCQFLSPRLFLLACRNSGDARFQHGRLQLYTLSDDLYPEVTVTHIASLELPELAIPNPIHSRLVSMAIMAGPYTAYPTPGAPYYQANDRRIVTFVIRYDPGDWVRLVVHIQTLLALVDDYRGGEVIARKWEEWGPQKTRMLHGMRHLWPRHVHGEWIALPTPSSRYIRLLDFNVHLPLETHQNDLDAVHEHPSGLDPHSASQLSEPSDSILTNIISTADASPHGFTPLQDSDTRTDVDILHTAPSELQIPIFVTASTDDSQPIVAVNPDDDADARQPEQPEPRSMLLGLFKHPVRTTLPYREVQRAIGSNGPTTDAELEATEEYDLFLLDEGHVIAADTANADYEVVVFRMS
ncbi:hypothetical protein C8F01DRAFT_1239149 [Mycena amicta]|nr:hypothetical protein C8F01DRAFT_1239149 [Mycena amicta]